jgi:hypothetical protein
MDEHTNFSVVLGRYRKRVKNLGGFGRDSIDGKKPRQPEALLKTSFCFLVIPFPDKDDRQTCVL